MSRGGARPGAGRKAEGGKRVTYTCRVLPSTRDTLREMKGAGIRIGVILDSVAISWREQKK